MKKHVQTLILAILLMGMACSSSESDEDLVPLPNPTPDPIPAPSGSTDIKIVNDEFEGHSIMIVGNATLNFMVAFNRMTNDKRINFSAVQKLELR